MAIYEIPINSDQENFIQETDLDGVTYRLEFRWNERESEWYLTVRDVDDVILCASKKLVTGAPLLRLAYDERLPAGELLAVNTVGDGQSSAGRYDLGTKIVLGYLDAEETEISRSVAVRELGGIIVHAEMKMDTPAAKAVSIATWAKLSGTWAEGALDGFVFDENGRLTYSGAEARTFLITATLTIESDTSTDVLIGIAFDGEEPEAEDSVGIDNVNNDDGLLYAASRVVEFTSGMFIEIYGKAAGACNLTVNKGQVTVIG